MQLFSHQSHDLSNSINGSGNMVLFIIGAIFIAIFFIFSEEIKTVKERDPAATSALEVLLLYPGLHALVFYRISHKLWEWKVPIIPRWLSQSARFFTGIEIHPGAQIGKSFFIDHG